MDYKNGKIYSIRSFQTDKYYIGSTTQPLSKRMVNHRTDFKTWCANNSDSYTTSYEILKFDDAYIELIENFECNSRDELCKREGEIMREHITEIVNKNIAGRTQKEYIKQNREKNKDKIKEYRKANNEKIKEHKRKYRNANKDKIKEYRKQYREKNKDKIKEYQKEYCKAKKDKLKDISILPAAIPNF